MAAPILNLIVEYDNAASRIHENALHGAHLTHQEAKTCYAIIRHNVRTYESAGVVEVTKGKQAAAAAVRVFEDGQSSEDRHEGWRYFLEETVLKPGMDPEQATHQRQTDLENRESIALDHVNSAPARRY